MGSIKVNRNEECDLTTFTAEGIILADDVVRAVDSFYHGPLTLNVLWDISGADVSQIAATDIQKIVHLSVDHAKTREGGKTAIVATEDLTFGLSRVYEMIKDTEDLSFQTRVFRSIDDANSWLSE